MNIMMDRTVSILGAAGIGAGLMYFLDPDRGNRRRALTVDKAAHAANLTTKGIGTIWRDAGNRSTGLLAEFRKTLGRTPLDDRQLEAHVRSELGYLVEHPRSIEVAAQNGRIILRGPILSRELDQCLSHIQNISGVTEVENQLDVHESAEGIPALQGGAPRAKRFELLQTNWSPTARLLAGSAGGSLFLYGLSRRNVGSILGGLAGAALLARAATDLPLTRLTGAGAGHRAIDVRKTMIIAAPRQRVFEFWSHCEDFPKYTRHVLDVLDLPDGRSRWKVRSPAGLEFTWTSMIERIPNEVLAWKTEPGAYVQHAGHLRFSDAEEGTIIHMRLTYNPPGGALGHGIAKMFRSDLETLLESECSRIKTFLETGAIPKDASRAGDTMSQSLGQDA
jgi:uncharacterized membrane protein